MWKWLAIVALCTAQTPDAGRVNRHRQEAPASCRAERPGPDSGCNSDLDCTLVWRMVSCCGTEVVTGINKKDVARFQAQERPCNVARTCGCAAAPTVLDDGSRVDQKKRVQVACGTRNLCTTFLEPLPPPLTSTTVKELATCSVHECGPAPTYPSKSCPDGVNVAGRGPCVRENGVCHWTRLVCP